MCVYRRHLLLLTVVSAALAAPVLGQQEDDEAEHDALRELKAVFEQAVNETQLDLLKPHLDERFSVVTYTDSSFTDFQVFKTRWQESRERLLAGGSYHVELLPERSLLLGDVALALGNSDNVLTTGGGAEYHYGSNWTAVLRKVDGQWKILRVHSSLDPFGNPMIRDGFVQAATKLGWVVGIAAFVVGLACGWLGKSLWSRRTKRENTE